jgi:hypothetical protein
VGLCLLLISGRRYPDSDLIWTWLIRSRRLAGPVCLGLLLLLPSSWPARAGPCSARNRP